MPQSPDYHRRGGEQRAANLDQDERKAIARRAAETRWQSPDTTADGRPLRAITGSIDRPLKLSRASLRVYVLNDLTPVATLDSVAEVLGIAAGSGGTKTSSRLVAIARSLNVMEHVSIATMLGLERPLRFIDETPDVVRGYAAKTVSGFCRAIKRTEERHPGTVRANIVLGVRNIVEGVEPAIDLDEKIRQLTGLSEYMAQQAIAKQINAEVPKPLKLRLETFPTDFFVEYCRLTGGQPLRSDVPPEGLIEAIEEMIHRRVPTLTYRALKKWHSAKPRGRWWKKHRPEYLTEQECHEGLRRHCAALVALMRVSDDYDHFRILLNRAMPVYR